MMMRMRLLMLALFPAVTVTAGITVDPFDTNVTQGKWCGNLEAATNAAAKAELPLVLFWGSDTCDHCQALSNGLALETSWTSSQQAYFCFVEGHKGSDVSPNYGAKEFALTAGGMLPKISPADYPFISFWWPRANNYQAFTGRLGTMPVKEGSTLAAQFKGSFEKFVADSREPENSAAHPYWIGERKIDEFKWGEWSMDLDAVTNCVKTWNKAHPSEKAYAVVLFAGSLWCPDCINTDANLFARDEFKAWAREKRVLFAMIDLPRDPADPDSVPCLVDRRPAASGKSGAAYLNWKKADEQTIAQVVARNRVLAGNDARNGGWNTPDRVDKGSSRPGVPILVALRDDGTAAGRLTEFASTSPKSFNNLYLTRLDELLASVSNAPQNAGEEVNDFYQTTKTCLVPSEVVSTGQLSALDAQDVYQLTPAESVRATFTLISKDGAPMTVMVTEELGGVSRVIASGETGVAGQVSITANVEAKNCFLTVGRQKNAPAFDFYSTSRTEAAYVLSSQVVNGGGEIGFAAEKISVDEGPSGVRTPVAVVVERKYGSQGAARVTAKLAEGYTLPESRIDWSDMTFTWAAGESGSKTNVFFVIGNDAPEESLLFKIVLTDLIAKDAVLSKERSTLAIEVRDDDVFGTLLHRNVAFEEVVPLEDWKAGDSVGIRKIGGSMPSGLTAHIKDGKLVIAGVPTRKGETSAQFIVTIRRGGVMVSTEEIDFSATVCELSPEAGGGLATESRTYSGLPVIVEDVVRGLVTFSSPRSGRLSAKYQTRGKTYTYGCNYWATYDAAKQQALTAKLECLTGEAEPMELMVDATSGGLRFTDPTDGEVIDLPLPAQTWSAEMPASVWAGQYAVQLPQTNATHAAGISAPNGAGYMALRMITESDLSRGSMLYAGLLPDGRAFYGRGTLIQAGKQVLLPFYHSGEGLFAPFAFSGEFAIDPNAATLYQTAPWSVRESVTTLWETLDASGTTCAFNVFGGYYDKSRVGEMFRKDFDGEEENFAFFAGTDTLVAGRFGASLAMDCVEARMNGNSPELFAGDLNPQEVTLHFSEETGVVSGSFYVPLASGDRTAVTYRGIALPGWQGCATCSDTFEQRPWAIGLFSFTDQITSGWFRNGGAIKFDRKETVE